MRICIYIRQAGGALERVRESRYALAMQLIRHRPAAPLDAYIECLWWSRRDQAENSGEHMLPSGRAQLILALHEAPIICRPNAASKPPTVWSRGIVHGRSGVTTNLVQSRPALWPVLRSGQALPAQFWGFRLLS
jgi:hypothetical protein